ncbi:cell wall metabolism sensor histidine kinase WalK [Patescibacteria group bacterium]|nr:cell wall metabolism sensor histidine kinase WalK [Patescibacteria group bacterium]
MIFKSIRGKLFWGILFLIVLISLCFLTFFVYQVNNFTRNTLINFGFHLVQDLSRGSEIGIASEDPILLQPTFERVFEERDVVLVTIYNKKGQIVASKKKTEIEERISVEDMKALLEDKKELKKIGFTQAGKEVFDFYVPVLAKEQMFPLFEKPEELIGFVRVVLSLESSHEQNRQLLFFGLFIAALMIFLGTLISFVFSKKITKPFGVLMQGTKVIAKGNLDYQIKIKTGDETEELAESFNRMTEDLKKSHVALEEEKTRAEEERDKTLTIINNFTDGLLFFDKENKLLLINPQAEFFLKIKTNEITGKSFSELTQYSNFKPFIDLLGREIKGIFRKEVSIKENLILEISTVPMISGEEKLGTLVILHDVTREKTIEKLKTEFVSLAAHQLRTPLSAVKWALSLVLDRDLGKINEKQKDTLQQGYQSNERMINLINDLLNVARIEEGRFLFEFSKVSFEELVRQALEDFQPFLKIKGIAIKIEKPKDDKLEVMVDVEKMKLALQNLIENAVNYSPNNSSVTISLKRDKMDLVSAVKDEGMGIPKNQQSRVFSKFFRGDNAVKMETEGTGLGLFITKNIIESHGGKIWFETQEGKGTTVFFSLPLLTEKI